MPYRSPRDWRFRIVDMLDAMARCRDFSDGISRGDFLRDEKTQAAVLYNLQIIGEAANHIPAMFLQSSPRRGIGSSECAIASCMATF